MSHALIIGAGPAGLMAAEALAKAGHRVEVAEAMPSPGRKFLMAGKSGLNLTKSEDFGAFTAAYDCPEIAPMLEAFGPVDAQTWAEGLEQPLFTGTTGRVFPKAMKASPLLRAWLARLDGLGVTLRRRWRWTGWDGDAWLFDTPQGAQSLTPDVAVMACGGASWARLGSDGAWAAHLPDHVAPFQPANMGLRRVWSDHMRPYFGTPIKGTGLNAGHTQGRGEFVITANGLEGGGIYELSKTLRTGAPLIIDLMPDLSEDEIRTRLNRPRGKASLGTHIRKTLRLAPVKQALLMELARPLPDDLAPVIKALSLTHDGPAQMDGAISTAGGLRWDALDASLMLRDRPGTFAAGEMLDWEAPTGGYLITGCMATGLWAGRAAARYAAIAKPGSPVPS
ncbi:MAG: TIGR03862 family flavoprotein [Roseovarius sp.]